MSKKIMEDSLPKMRKLGWDKIQAKGRNGKSEQSLLSHSISTASIAMEIVNACDGLLSDYDVDKEKAFVGGLIHDLHKDLDDEKGEGYSKLNTGYVREWMEKLSLESYIDEETTIEFWKALIKTAHPYSGKRKSLGDIKRRDNLQLLFTVQLADTIASITEIEGVLDETSKYRSVKKIVKKIDSELTLMTHRTREIRPALTAAIHDASREALKDKNIYSVASYSNGDVYLGKREGINSIDREILKGKIGNITKDIVKCEIFDEDNHKNYPISRGRAGLDVSNTLLLQPLSKSLRDAVEYSFIKGPGAGHAKQVKKYIGKVMKIIIEAVAEEEGIEAYELKGREDKSEKKFHIFVGENGSVELIPDNIKKRGEGIFEDDLFKIYYDENGHLNISTEMRARKEVGVLAELLQVITKKIKESSGLNPVKSFKKVTEALVFDVKYDKYPRRSISAGGTYYFQFPIALKVYNQMLDEDIGGDNKNGFENMKRLRDHVLSQLEELIEGLEEESPFNLLDSVGSYVNSILELTRYNAFNDVEEWVSRGVKTNKKVQMENICFLCGSKSNKKLSYSADDFKHTKSFSFRALGGKEADSKWFLCEECYIDQLILDKKLRGGDQKNSLAVVLYPEFHITSTRLKLIESQLDRMNTKEVIEWSNDILTSDFDEPLTMVAIDEEEIGRLSVDKVVDSRNYILLRMGPMTVGNDNYLEDVTWLRSIFAACMSSYLLSMKAEVTPRLMPSTDESSEIEGRVEINKPPAKINEILPKMISSYDLEGAIDLIGALFYSGKYLDENGNYTKSIKGVNRVLEMMCSRYFPGSSLFRVSEREGSGDTKLDDVVSILDRWKSELIFKKINKNKKKKEEQPLNRIKKVAKKLYKYYRPNLSASTHIYQKPIRKIIDVVIENSRLDKEEVISMASGELLRIAERHLNMRSSDVFIHLSDDDGSLEELVTDFVTSFYEDIYVGMLNEDRIRLVRQRNSIADAIFADLKQRSREGSIKNGESKQSKISEGGKL